MSPILDSICSKYSKSLEFIKVDSDESGNEDLLRKYDIRSIPSLLLLDADGDVLDLKVGAMSAHQLDAWLTFYLEKEGLL